MTNAENLEDLAGKLTGASETLLIPLAGRARASKEKTVKGFSDPAAETLCETLNIEVDRYAPDRATLLGVIHRGKYYDSRVINFLKRHPNGTVVNIGAGLNTSYDRVKAKAGPGNWRWIDTDLPR